MWYNEIPELNLTSWLSGVMQLFDHTLDALIAQPYFSNLLGLLLFLIVAALLALLIRQGRKGKLG